MHTGKNEIIKLKTGIAMLGILAISGCFPLGGPLYAQDQLLKEYIYLDGRLLVIERRPTPAIAQQPARIEDKELNAGLPVNGRLLPGISFPYPQESAADIVAPDECLEAPASSPECATK